MRLLLAMVALVACSSSKPAPVRETFAQLARIPELAGHLGEGGSLELHRDGWSVAQGAFRRLDDLDVRVNGTRVRLARVDDPDAWIELGDEAGALGKLEIRGAAIVHRESIRETEIVHVIERARYEELRLLRSKDAPSVTRQRVRLGPSIASLRVRDGRIEAVDRDGRVRIESAPAFAVDDRGERRLASTTVAGDLLSIAIDATGLAFPVTVDPLWTATPDLAKPRYAHGAGPLPDGRAFIAGGLRAFGSSLALSDTFAYDPSAKTWTARAGMPDGPTDSFSMIVLSSGKLLVTGGNAGGLPNRQAYAYDASSDAWVYGGNHGAPYRCEIAAPLSAERALCVSQPDALLWSLAAKTFTAAGTTTVTHSGQTATTLDADRVLVVGGSKTADLWDPGTSTFSAGGTTIDTRSDHTATRLASGKVLFVGGAGLSTAELYDPATKTFASAGSMSTVRTQHTATLLPNDRVIVIGGRDGSGTLSTTEIYDAASNSWSAAAPLSIKRARHTATLLPGPRVLVVGGVDDTTAHSTAEVFAPVTNGGACTGANDCASGFCVDGVCCESACTGQCEACDVGGSEGSCKPVTGAPHGSRTGCSGGTGVCARACDGSDRAKCNFAATTVVCSAASCASGTSASETRCDGAGNCPAPTTSECAPYACGASACKTSCTTDTDCGGANVCDTKTGKCVVAQTSTCSPDLSLEVPTDGSAAKACAPYLCDRTTNKCASRCTSSGDCAAGNLCDVASGVCGPGPALPAGTDEVSGCAHAAGSPSQMPSLLIAALLATAVARARSRR